MNGEILDQRKAEAAAATGQISDSDSNPKQS
jgi:hypothetical protein